MCSVRVAAVSDWDIDDEGALFTSEWKVEPRVPQGLLSERMIGSLFNAGVGAWRIVEGGTQIL